MSRARGIINALDFHVCGCRQRLMARLGRVVVRAVERATTARTGVNSHCYVTTVATWKPKPYGKGQQIHSKHQAGAYE